MNALTRPAATAVRPVLVPTTFDQLVRFSEMAATSGLMPKDYINKPGAIMIAVQMGSELGLQPMQSLTSIAVINGRPGLWGDGLIGICRQSPLCQDIAEHIEGEGDARTAVCVATRRGATPCTSRFSVADAKRAGLWGKTGPWSQYPDRMLQNRARGFALRDAFPDLLRGLKTVEELRDTPPDTFRGPTLDAEAAPAAKPIPSQPPVSENGAPPPKRRTRRDFLNELQATLAACHTIDEVDEVAQSDDVVAAIASFTNGALDELNALLAAAIHRTQTDPDPGTADSILADAEDDFPGDK